MLRQFVNDDLRMIEMALNGDEDAFGQLVRHYQDRLFTSVVHVVGNREEAEDVVQEAFVNAFLKLHTFQRSSTFYTWLYRIAFNGAVNRKRRKRPEVSMDHTQETGRPEPQDPGDSPGQQLLRRERIGQIQAALDMLGEEHRAVLVLREIEGCDYETIAEILDLSLGTVRSRLHRARAEMREQLRIMQQENPAD